MRESTLRKLIKLVEESRISELEIRRFWTKVRIRKDFARSNQLQAGQHASGVDVLVHAAGGVQGEIVREGATRNTVTIASPMVGTFYRAPAPNALPYVEIGDRVTPGQVVCLIEAMKLMNEIESEVRGSIEEILVENEQPVEYGQELFRVAVP
jgi:acetyl-CoA carboxylase biotin carboxyl carrier protein